MVGPVPVAVKEAFSRGRSVAWTVALAICVLWSGCYWLRYYDLLETHVGLMAGLAADAADQVRAGYPLHPDDIERMRYPLERALQFSRIARRRFPERESLDRFDELAAAYRRLIESLDRVRLGGGAADEVSSLAAEVADRAARLREAVASERGESR